MNHAIDFVSLFTWCMPYGFQIKNLISKYYEEWNEQQL